MMFKSIHCIWCILSAISPQYNVTAGSGAPPTPPPPLARLSLYPFPVQITSAGIWAASALSGYGYSKIAIIYIVGGIMWLLASLLAFFSLRTDYRHYRARGHTNAQIGAIVGGSAAAAGMAARTVL